ncbi:MAG: DUF5017 domain-containing protein [Pedobacter sp.]|uniref:DUF5017 domain-containing protein n=1 Tax=Pedobacter sp. TaxID=1411316 RepID=UPI0035627F3F
MKIYLFFLTFLLFTASACKKEIEIVTPDFDVENQELTVKVNESLTFNFKGTSDIISFYSGENGSSYAYVDQSRALESDISLKFDSQILDGKQENQFSVLVSSDFNGTYDLANLDKADWINITDRFRMATHEDNRALVPSGEIKITDLIVNNKPIYIAFKYITKPQTTYGQYNLWRIQNLLLQSSDEINGKVSMMAQSAGGWKSIQSSNYEPNRGYIYTNNITFTGNATNGPKKDDETEAWVVSKSIPAVTVTDLGPDRSVAIKSISDPALKSYSYTYSKTGKYTATFVGLNANLDRTKQVAKQVTVTVVE